MNNDCPNCKRYSFPNWKKALAFWPFQLRCGNCNASVRAKIPKWQNILVQIVGQIVFWTALLLGIRNGSQGALVGGTVGAALAVLIATIPVWGAELEEISNHRV